MRLILLLGGFWQQPTGRLKGVDGKNVPKGDTDTVYGPDADAHGVVSKMSATDSTLLTGIANVISGASPGFNDNIFC